MTIHNGSLGAWEVECLGLGRARLGTLFLDVSRGGNLLYPQPLLDTTSQIQLWGVDIRCIHNPFWIQRAKLAYMGTRGAMLAVCFWCL